MHRLTVFQATSRDDALPAACASCVGRGATDRREFLRDALVVVTATLAALGLSGAEVDAMPLRTAVPLAARGATRRYALPAADGAEIDRANEVILTRWQNAVYAFSLACPHQHVALRWLDADQRFQCPKHRSKYRPDGSFIEGRATRGLDRFAIARDASGGIVVDLDVLHEQDSDAAGWNAAVVRLA